MYTIPWDPITNAPSTSMIQRDSDGAWIPNDPLNTVYIAYLEWVRTGGVATIASSPIAPSSSLSINNFQQLMDLFTEEELHEIVVATDPQIRINVWQALSALPGGIQASDPKFIQWVTDLESAGIIDQLRAVLISSLIPPQ